MSKIADEPDAQTAEPEGGGESKGTVLLAGTSNLVIAVAKIVAGLVTGSSAMLAEGAHSIADTMNQAFLLTSLSRSKKPADEAHPFGYGQERYFWALLAAVGIFVLGAGFSFYEGVHALIAPEPASDLLWAYGVLGISFVFEGSSWLKAVIQLRREAKEADTGTIRHIISSPDPTAKTVAFEDTAALIGIVLAALGVTLDALTGSGRWDGVASMLIGLLLVVVAYSLGRQSMDLLIGQSLPRSQQDAIRHVIDVSPGVDRVVELITVRLSPEEVLVAARVDVDDTASGGDLERFADEVDQRVRAEVPEARHVFLDPTPSRPR